MDTNFGPADIPEALDIVSKVGINNITTTRLPGIPKTMDRVSYFVHDKEKTKEMVDEIFRGKTKEFESTEVN